MCTILLTKDCFDNTIYRWLKELRNIRPKKYQRLGTFKSNQNGKDSPHQFQLAKANVAVLIIVSSRSKSDVLRFFSIPKPKFGCLVKTMDDMIQIIDIK